jgi:hypothetical protein
VHSTPGPPPTPCERACHAAGDSCRSGCADMRCNDFCSALAQGCNQGCADSAAAPHRTEALR